MAGEHLLGVALMALMRVPPARRAAVYAEALRRLAERGKMTIGGISCWTAWRHTLTLDDVQAQELEALLRTERYQGTQAMAVTTFEKGVQAGGSDGLRQGQRTMLQKQLEARFGPLNPVSNGASRA